MDSFQVAELLEKGRRVALSFSTYAEYVGSKVK